MAFLIPGNQDLGVSYGVMRICVSKHDILLVLVSLHPLEADSLGLGSRQELAHGADGAVRSQGIRQRATNAGLSSLLPHLPPMQGIQEMGTARLVKFGIAVQLTKCRNALCGHWSHVGSCESIPLEPAVGAPHASARVRPMQSFESPARQMPAQSNYWADMNNQMTGGCNNEVRSRMLKVYLDFTSWLYVVLLFEMLAPH